MLKIIVGKADGAKTVIKKIEDAEGENVTLVIPKQSAFGDEVQNFDVLREAATELSKNVTIESVDENVLALARANEFVAMHPLFRGGELGGEVSDILPAKATFKNKLALEKKTHASRAKKEKEPVPLHEIRAEEKIEIEGESEEEPKRVHIKEDVHEIFEENREEHLRSRPKRNIILGGLGIVAVLGVVYFLGVKVFGYADITVRFQKMPWQDTSSLTASVSAAALNGTVLPGQLFTQVKTATQLYPASGKANVSTKAAGKITIYNAYDSKPQTLVATTRFQTPDGKIVRLVKQVLIPGANITNGKIIPSSIMADVIADKPGADYNVGPLPKLTIPGFEGGPKFDGFYGSLEQQLTGGFVGVRMVPSAAEIASAKQKTADALKAAFGPSFFQNIPQGFVVPDGATNVVVTKMTVDTATGADGNFSVVGEAKFTAIGFKEDDVKTFLLSKAAMNQPNAKFEDLKLTYSKAQPDFQKGSVKFTVSSQGIVTPNFDADAFKNSVLSLSEADAKAALLKIQDLADGKLVLRPFWLTHIPTAKGKVKITVE